MKEKLGEESLLGVRGVTDLCSFIDISIYGSLNYMYRLFYPKIRFAISVIQLTYETAVIIYVSGVLLIVIMTLQILLNPNSIESSVYCNNRIRCFSNLIHGTSNQVLIRIRLNPFTYTICITSKLLAQHMYLIMREIH